MAAAKKTATKKAKPAAKKSASAKPRVAVAPPPVAAPIAPPDLEEDEGEEDEGEEDEDEDDKFLLAYDPRTHGVYELTSQTVLPIASVVALTETKQTINRDSIAFFEAQGKQYETFFNGFTSTAEITKGQIKDDREYIRSLRDEGDQLRRAYAEKEMEIARMVRASEEARLERERLAAQVQQGEQLIRRIEEEHSHKERLRAQDLAAVGQNMTPIVTALAKQVPFLMSSFLTKSGGADAPAGLPAPAPAEPGKAPEPGVSVDSIEEFRALFSDVYGTLSKESLACLRAVMCSYAFPQQAPPLPKVVPELLIRYVTRDAPPEKLQGLMIHVASSAYVDPEAASANGQAHAPPNGAMN